MSTPHTLADQLSACFAEKQEVEKDYHLELVGRLLAEKRLADAAKQKAKQSHGMLDEHKKA